MSKDKHGLDELYHTPPTLFFKFDSTLSYSYAYQKNSSGDQTISLLTIAHDAMKLIRILTASTVLANIIVQVDPKKGNKQIVNHLDTIYHTIIIVIIICS